MYQNDTLKRKITDKEKTEKGKKCLTDFIRISSSSCHVWCWWVLIFSCLFNLFFGTKRTEAVVSDTVHCAWTESTKRKFVAECQHSVIDLVASVFSRVLFQCFLSGKQKGLNKGCLEQNCLCNLFLDVELSWGAMLDTVLVPVCSPFRCCDPCSFRSQFGCAQLKISMWPNRLKLTFLIRPMQHHLGTGKGNCCPESSGPLLVQFPNSSFCWSFPCCFHLCSRHVAIILTIYQTWLLDKKSRMNRTMDWLNPYHGFPPVSLSGTQMPIKLGEISSSGLRDNRLEMIYNENCRIQMLIDASSNCSCVLIFQWI